MNKLDGSFYNENKSSLKHIKNQLINEFDVFNKDVKMQTIMKRFEN